MGIRETPDNGQNHFGLTRQSAVTATPAALALDNNFRTAMRGLKRELVRSIHFLRMIYDRKVYRALGYADIRTYAAAAGGLSDGQCRAFLRIGAALTEAPLVAQALSDGSLTVGKAALIADRVDGRNQSHLIDLAKGFTKTQLAAHLKAKPVSKPEAGWSESERPRQIPRPKPMPQPSRAERPPAVQPADTPCYVTFKFTPEQYAVWAETMVGAAGTSKEEILVAALTSGEATVSDGGPHFLLHLQVCPTCDRATMTTKRGTFAVPPVLLDTARCDAVVENADARRRRVISPRLRRRVLRRDGHQCQAAGCSNTRYLQLHHRRPVACGGQTCLENLVTLCGRCHRALHHGEAGLEMAGRDPAR